MEEALISLLLTDGTIATLVGTRVWPAARPQGSDLPALVVTRISGAPGYADDGEIGLEPARFQIDSWSLTYGDGKVLSRAVRSALSAFSGVHAGVNFSYIMLDEERDLRESGSNQADYPFRIAQDYIVHVRG